MEYAAKIDIFYSRRSAGDFKIIPNQKEIAHALLNTGEYIAIIGGLIDFDEDGFRKLNGPKLNCTTPNFLTHTKFSESDLLRAVFFNHPDKSNKTLYLIDVGGLSISRKN